MSDFSPIPLERVKKQFHGYADPKDTLNALHNTPKSPLKALSSADINLLSPIYQARNDFKASLNFDKEKQVLHNAGYSNKLLTSVLDELTKKAEKISNSLGAPSPLRSPLKSRANSPLKHGSMEERFNVIHQREFSKMPLITSHYSAIRRRKQLEMNRRDREMERNEIEQEREEIEYPVQRDAAERFSPIRPQFSALEKRNAKRQLSPEPRYENLTEMDISYEKNGGISRASPRKLTLSPQKTDTEHHTSPEKKTVDQAEMPIAPTEMDISKDHSVLSPQSTLPNALSPKTKRALASEISPEPNKRSSSVMGTPKQSKRSSGVELGSASKRRRTLIGPREVPTTFQSPSKEDINMSTDSTSFVDSFQKGDHIDAEKVQRQVEEILGAAAEEVENAPRSTSAIMKDFIQGKNRTENMEKYILDDKPIPPLRINKNHSPSTRNNETNELRSLSSGNLSSSIPFGVGLDNADMNNGSAMPKLSDTKKPSLTSNTVFSSNVPLSRSPFATPFTGLQSKPLQAQKEADLTIDQSMIRRFDNANIYSDHEDSVQDVSMIGISSIPKAQPKKPTKSTRMLHKIVPPARATKKSEARSNQVHNFSYSKSLSKARDLSNSSSKTVNSSQARVGSNSSTESNGGFVKPVGRASVKPRAINRETNNTQFRGTQNTLKTSRSIEMLRKYLQKSMPPPELPKDGPHRLIKKSSIPRFSQPTASSLSRQSSKTSLNGYLTNSSSSSTLRKATIKSSTSNMSVLESREKKLNKSRSVLRLNQGKPSYGR